MSVGGRRDGTGPARDELEAWAADRYVREDAILEELREALAEAGFPLIQVPARTGRLLQTLVRAAGARRVVEVGTLGGYSAIWIARGLPADGRMVTCEINPDHARLARRFLERAGLSDRVEVRVGRAVDLLEDLEEGVWDVVFLDADKESYPTYLDQAARLLRPGGMVLADNAFLHGSVLEEAPSEARVQGMHRFHESLAERDDFVATVIPAGDGVAIGVKS